MWHASLTVDRVRVRDQKELRAFRARHSFSPQRSRSRAPRVMDAVSTYFKAGRIPYCDDGGRFVIVEYHSVTERLFDAVVELINLDLQF